MKKFLAVFIIVAALSGISLAHAVNISLSFPTSNGASNPCANPTSNTCNPGNYINGLYSFALLIGGLLAFGAIMFGGVKYMTAAGNPSSQSEGKQWIESALLGLLLLVGAYLILYTVNPNLTQLGLPTLKPSPITGSSSGASSQF